MFEDRSGAVLRYRELRPKYESYSNRVRGLLEDLCKPLRVHILTARAKDEESFRQKALRRTDSGEFTYREPLAEIEDLAGVRVICFSNSQVAEVCQLVRENFSIFETIDKAKELVAAGRVGYVSQHFIVGVHQSRAKLPEYVEFQGLKCEVQVRTVFQHAWAEVEHRLQYKDDNPKPELRARFQALAGLVQIADREFDQLFELDTKLSEHIRMSVAEVPAEDENEFQNSGIEEHDHKLTSASNLFGVPPKVLVSRGEYDRAIETYDGLIALQPRQSWHYIGRAKARLLKGDVTGAYKDIEALKDIGAVDQRIRDAVRRLERALVGGDFSHYT